MRHIFIYGTHPPRLAADPDPKLPSWKRIRIRIGSIAGEYFGLFELLLETSYKYDLYGTKIRRQHQHQ
jgi:hypothetical protein